MSPILHRDLVHTWWALGRSPFYATLVTLMLGVMIGAATALFAIVDGIVWRPLPLPEPGRVVMVWETAVREDTRSSASRRATSPTGPPRSASSRGSRSSAPARGRPRATTNPSS